MLKSSSKLKKGIQAEKILCNTYIMTVHSDGSLRDRYLFFLFMSVTELVTLAPSVIFTRYNIANFDIAVLVYSGVDCPGLCQQPA